MFFQQNKYTTPKNPYLFKNNQVDSYLNNKKKEKYDILVSEQLKELSKPITSYASRITSFKIYQ